MPAPTITDLPDAPLRSQGPTTFSPTAEAFVVAMQPLVNEINAFGDYLNALGITVQSWKFPVRLKTTANHGLSGLADIDGVTPVAGNRIFVGSNTAGEENGIYIAAAGTWTRAVDMDEANEVLGAAIYVIAGSTNGGTLWFNTNTAEPEIDTDALTFSPFTGGGASSLGDLSDVTLTSVAQGDILYRGASGWVNLGAGNSGDHLLSGGSGANPVWTTLSSDAGGGGIFEIKPSKPLSSSFTLENAGTASVSDGAFGMVLDMPSSSVNIRFLRYTAGLPGSSWDLRMRSSMVTPYFTGNIHHGSILLRNSSNGRLINFALSGGNIVIQNWSSYISFNSTIASFSGVYGPNGIWKRVTSDGTTLRFYTGSNGSDWCEVANVAIATYIGAGLDQVGVGSVNGAVSGVTNEDVFEHFTLT